jgi:hypothetical protein
MHLKKQAFTAASVATLLATSTTVEGFQPSASLSSSSWSTGGHHHRQSRQQQSQPRSHRQMQSLHTLFYAMPDITTMKAMEMKQELESYGISTKSLFDKRDFEQALMEARNDYEATLNDVMGQGTTTNKKKNNTQQQKVHVNGAGRSAWSTDDPYSTTYRSSSTSSRSSPFGGDGRNAGGRSSSSYHHDYKSGSMWDHASPIEEDPLNAYDQQNYDFHSEFNQHFQYHPNDPAARKQQQKREKERANDWTYRSDAARAAAAAQYYSDPALQVKYQHALEEAKKMSVAELQDALNERGISTKFCIVMADFRHEYAMAIVENKPKLDKKTVEDDEDYDPSYKDVVMERYDPAKMF